MKMIFGAIYVKGVMNGVMNYVLKLLELIARHVEFLEHSAVPILLFHDIVLSILCLVMILSGVIMRPSC